MLCCECALHNAEDVAEDAAEDAAEDVAEDVAEDAAHSVLPYKALAGRKNMCFLMVEGTQYSK